MKTIIDALKYSCEKKNIYPKTGVVVFRIWLTIFVLVGIQLAWSLRPFLGDRNEPFKLFRQYEGNFYTAVIYSIRQLVSPGIGQEEKVENPGKKGHQSVDLNSLFGTDSLQN